MPNSDTAENFSNHASAPVASLSAFRSAIAGKNGGRDIVPELLKIVNALSLNTRRALESEAFYPHCSYSGQSGLSRLAITYAPVANLTEPSAKLEIIRDDNYLYTLKAEAQMTASCIPYSSCHTFHGNHLSEITRHILLWAAIAAQANKVNQSVVREVSLAATGRDVYAESFIQPESPVVVPKYLDEERKAVSLQFRALQEKPRDRVSQLQGLSLQDDAFDEMLNHARDLCDSVNRNPVTGGGFRIVREEAYPLGARLLKVQYDFDAESACRPVALPSVEFSFRERKDGNFEVLAESRESAHIPQLFIAGNSRLFFQARAALHDWARAAIGLQSGGQRGALENFIEISERLGNDPLAQSWSPLDGGPKR